MTAPESPGNASTGDGAPVSDGVRSDGARSDGVRSDRARSRSLLSLAYTAATLLGGIAALVILAFTVIAADSSVLDVLLWVALAVLLFAAAAREWWFKSAELDRSRGAFPQISPAEIAAAARESSGEVETVRRLRQAHPGLRLVDAVNLVRGQNSSDP